MEIALEGVSAKQSVWSHDDVSQAGRDGVHGEQEATIASELAEAHGFTRVGQSSYCDGLLDRAMPPILSLWKKPR